MTKPAAEAAILSARLVVGAITTEHSETVPEGSVISQNPAATTSVVENSFVDLTISLGSANQPPLVSFSASPSSIAKGESSTLTWSSLRGESAHIDNDIGAVSVGGTILVSPESTTTYTLTVTGPAGSADARVTVQVTGNPEPQPEGSYGEQYEDLVPPDATVDQYDPERFSLITGLVHDINQLPLPEVTITLHSYAEYGSATTDDQGRFSIPVEGGGTFTVVFQKQGLISAQRKIYVPWNDNAIAETVVMIAEDPVATTLTFDGNADTVVTHKSEDVIDESGTRAVTMVFSGDNKAYLVDEQGNDVQELTTITTRATEYQIPEAMPAKLPPNSAFTFCAELSVDGAQRVRFDKPVLTYIDNFLGFPIGTIVPVGYYDRDRAIWVPSDNGVVVKLMDTDNDSFVDALDVDGDDEPDDLDSDGSFIDEVKGLDDPLKYAPGSTFWRFAVTHFTPWDCNWPYGPPDDAIAPNPLGQVTADLALEEPLPCPVVGSSYVDARSRIYHEDIPIPGTDITLHYSGNRVVGYKVAINVPASGDTVPDSLQEIIVNLEVGGKTLTQHLAPNTNQNAAFSWDGLDHMGRKVEGPITAHVNIGFVYEAFYYQPGLFAMSFAQAGEEVTSIRARQQVVSWKRNEVVIHSAPKGIGTLAEGWSLSNHHLLFPEDPHTLFMGDGKMSKNTAPMVKTVRARDGSLAQGLVTDSDGAIYWSDYNQIKKLDASGTVTVVAGTGTYGFSGDGGLATEAQLDNPTSICFDHIGNLYILDYDNHRVRKVDSNGIINTVAGTGESNWGFLIGMGGPATDAPIIPYDIAADNYGNLYISSLSDFIYKVDPNGIITHFKSFYDNPTAIAVDGDGNLYVSDQNGLIWKVDTNGSKTWIAGNNYSTCRNPGDGLPATEVCTGHVVDLEVDAYGNLYFADWGWTDRIRMVNPSGIITTFAGSGDCFDNCLPADAYMDTPSAITLSENGDMYISDISGIRKIGPPGGFSEHEATNNILFVDPNGLGYIMSADGLHAKTIDLDTGVVHREFIYNTYKELISIHDQFGNQTIVELNSTGTPVAIISPDNIRTELTIDENNHLIRITFPDGNFYRFEYSPGGLMTAEIEPDGNRFEHVFDALGRLTDATDGEGGHWNFNKTFIENGDTLSEVLTGEGNFTSYLDHTYSTGAYASTITDPTGAETYYSQSDDYLTVTKSLPCGMALEFNYDLDPEYLFRFIKKSTESTPAGLEKIALRAKTYEDTDSDEIPDLITETLTINGKATALEKNTLLAQKTITSPENRTITTLYDPDTLLTESVSIPGLHDTTYGYDPRGRLTSISTDTRQSIFTYNPEGFLESITDPESQTTTYEYDPTGRVTAINRPDGGSVGFTYDKNGNMMVLTNPVDVNHGFGFNKVNRNSSYTTPLSGSYSYIYDKDRRLIQTNFPSGKQIFKIYDKTRLSQIQTPEGNVDFTYLCSTKMDSITKGAESITYGYDGKLVTSETLSGTLNKALGYTYNDDFDVSSFTYAGQTENFSYDNDGLLDSAGNFNITRNAENGLPEAVSGGALNIARTFNGNGEVEGQDYNVSSQDVSSWALTRDDNGRVISKTETVGGVIATFEYTYDSMGRLLTVTKDGNPVPVEAYSYDLSGTRISETNTLRGITGRTFSYSDEDHLLTVGSVTYSYDLDGFLSTKTDGTDITTYSYSSRGELLNVTLPDGTVVEYLNDPLGRRIAKKVDGATTEKYLWQGLTRLLAVYDGSNSLLMRFEYAHDRMPVSMTSGGTTYYLTYNQVGSLRVVADSTGNVVKLLTYDSFGNIIDDTNPAFAVPFGFAGGLYDPDTELVRFGHRDYDPDIGRWTAKDPIFFAGGDTDLYGYVLNDPIGSADPLGLAPWWVGPSAKIPAGAGLILLGVGVLGPKPLIVPGIALLAIGGALEVWDWTTSPMEGIEKGKEWSEHLEKQMEENKKLMEELDIKTKPCP
jgi:RHS repeat-associated protein